MIVVAVDHNPLVLQCPKALIQSHCYLGLVYVKQFQTLLGHVFLEIFHPKKNIALLFLTQTRLVKAAFKYLVVRSSFSGAFVVCNEGLSWDLVSEL